jgi:hypothetical protein
MHLAAPAHTELACTIANRSMLPEVRVLARSFREHHPHVPFVVLIADGMPAGIEDEPFEALAFDTVGIGDELRFRARPHELSYLATPYLLRALLGAGCERIIFFKQETRVCSSARRLFDQLRRSSIVLAPHLTSPRTGPDAIEVERMVLNAGAFNVGVLGVANTATAREFLDWWAARVAHDSALAVERGVHYEQRWLTLVPTLFEGVHVDRNPGTNIGHWSLPDTDLRLVDGAPHANGEPVVALRFSGFDGDRPGSYSRYAPRLDERDPSDIDAFVARYACELAAAGHHERCHDYAWSAYDDGTPITDEHRDRYAALDAAQAAALGNPFRTGPGSLHELVGAAAGGTT